MVRSSRICLPNLLISRVCLHCGCLHLISSSDGPCAHEILVGVSTGLTRSRDFETNVRRCERWCVTKLCERWCVTKIVWKMVGDKDGVWKMVCDKVGVWKMVCDKVGVWKMVCDKDCVWKMVGEKDGVWKMVCDKVGVWKMVCDKVVVWKMVCDKVGMWKRWCMTRRRRRRQRRRRTRRRDTESKTRTPHKDVGKNIEPLLTITESTPVDQWSAMAWPSWLSSADMGWSFDDAIDHLWHSFKWQVVVLWSTGSWNKESQPLYKLMFADCLSHPSQKYTGRSGMFMDWYSR